MKEQIIQIPDTLEIKEIKDGKIILVEKEKKLTYEDIAEELFSKPVFYIGANGDIEPAGNLSNYVTNLNNCTSKRQAEKLLAINKLMNVAKYLNGDSDEAYWWPIKYTKVRLEAYDKLINLYKTKLKELC